MSASLRVVFAGGGTGGHLFPALAIAEALAAITPDPVVSFVGSKTRIEATVVPRHGYPFDAVWIAGLKRSFSLDTLLLPLKIAVSLVQSFRILRHRRPDVVVGTGGYASGPLVYTAAKLRVPTLIQEQNEHPGITTRLLAPRVDEVHITFESTARLLPPVRAMHCSGNPVRLSLRRTDPGAAREAFGLQPDVRTVLVFGGSLGAASVNGAVEALLPRLMEEGFQILWQTGVPQYERLSAYQNAYPGACAVRPFIDRMDDAYSAATLVVCRAGATSLAELTALGMPSILVPYPHATADHQARNAMALATQGAALVVEDRNLAELAPRMLALLRDQNELDALARASAALGKPRAAITVAEAVLRLSKRSQGNRR
jgi:UDP-N-acetylglucosamine--N-acetylmuramyl-(pentapeptide) pyrophosphoryl-undecaprenol N-acetylglucosamine transferase